MSGLGSGGPDEAVPPPDRAVPPPDEPGWHPVGDDAVLVDLPDGDAVARVGATLRAAPPDGVVDVVPAARTVLVRGSARGRARWADEVRRLVATALADAPAVAPVNPAPVERGTSTRDGHFLVPLSRGSAPVAAVPGGGPRVVEIPVVYDGEDLAAVAALTGLSVDEVVARHLAGGPGGYRVAFGGFMPGFAYVTGLDPALVVPRLDTPRTRVPAGAVAVAGEYTAVYPRETPGGWRLLGRTDAVMFDPSHDERPALLAPGDEVRFVAARERLAIAPNEPRGTNVVVAPGELLDTVVVAPDELLDTGVVVAPDEPCDTGVVVATYGPRDTRAVAPEGPLGDQTVVAPDGPLGARAAVALDAPAGGLAVVATGPLVLVEDAGRAGLAAVGVPRGGAADPAALRAANRLVGNAAGAAVLEVLLGGLVVRFAATTAFALVGAPAPAELDGRPVPHGRAMRAPAGSTLALGTPLRGLRTWLAVRGGIDVPAVLGSRSSDVLSGLGPAAVTAGDTLPLGRAFDGLPELPLDDEPGGSRPARLPALARLAGGTGPGDGGHAVGGTGNDAGVGAVAAPGVVVLEVTPGPRAHWLSDESRARLVSQVWAVTPASNRVALRLDGPPLVRGRTGELPSEGLVIGAVQLPPDGCPVVFGPDHPVTGGYPVVAVLTAAGVSAAAQCRPGDRVRFAPAAPF